MAQPLLEVKHLKTQFRTKRGTVTAVDDVSFSVNQGDTLGIVGESGCGKSVTSLSILQLLPHAVGSVAGGEILYKGEDIAKKGNKEMCRIRGREISMIFQDPMTALNPVFTVGYQINESLLYHDRAKTKSEAKQKAIRLLKDMGIPLPEKRVDEYPYQFSGGMCQRAMIAMAMSCQPKVLIADEPTTALDVTIQAQIFELMQDLKNNNDAAILLITHDMGVVAELADNVAVMYMGNIVESGDARAVLTRSAHPYTRALLKSIPVLGRGKKQELEPIKGSTPDPYDRPKGCQFAPRCGYATEQCMQEMPPETEIELGHFCRCFHNLMGKEGQPDAGN